MSRSHLWRPCRLVTSTTAEPAQKQEPIIISTTTKEAAINIIRAKGRVSSSSQQANAHTHQTMHTALVHNYIYVDQIPCMLNTHTMCIIILHPTLFPRPPLHDYGRDEDAAVKALEETRWSGGGGLELPVSHDSPSKAS